jgi:dUTP pyrophosphatase
MIEVPITFLPHGQGLALPERATPHAAGLDLRAALPPGETWTLAPGERRLVPTGLVMAIPPGHEGQVRPRSGLAFKHGVTVLNAPGTIDADYRGEVAVMLVNLGQAPFLLARGERVAQFLLAKLPDWAWRLETDTAALGDTQRGGGGYGSTGRS